MSFYHDQLGLPRDLPGTGAIARALINAGAPLNGRSGDKETPLITAASYGDAEVARVLIEAGADIEARSALDSGGVRGGNALLHAAVFGMTEVVDILVSAGASIDSLELAAAAGDISAWPSGRSPRSHPGAGLRRHGADPDLRDPSEHRTPLEWCLPPNRYLARAAHDEVEALLRPLTATTGP